MNWILDKSFEFPTSNFKQRKREVEKLTWMLLGVIRGNDNGVWQA